MGLSAVLAAASLCVFYDVAISWTSGTPDRVWGLWQLSRMRLASFLALGVAGALSATLLYRGWPTQRRTQALVCAGILLSVFLGNGRFIGSNDAAATRLIPFVLVREGRLCFEQSAQVALDPAALPYWFVTAREHIVSRYPVATGVLATPLYLPAVLGSYDPEHESVHELERIAAALLTLLGVACIGVIALRWLPPHEALGITAVYALGTSVASILSKALWQHVGGALGFSLALFGLFALRSHAKGSVVIGLGLGLAMAARSTNLAPALCVFGATLLSKGWRKLVWSALAAALPVCAQLLYARYYFGSFFGNGYGAEASEGWTAFWPTGTLGLLVSPGRGLWIYSPCLVFAAFALWKGAGVIEPRVSRMLLLGIALLLAVMGKWWCWWGGRSVGERMTSDVLPLWGVGLVLAARLLRERPHLRLAFVSTCVYAVAMHALITVARPGPVTRAQFIDVLGGAWDLQSYAPLCYLLDALTGWS